MAEFVKIGVRLATVAGLIALAVGIYALFTQVQIPAEDTRLIAEALGAGKAIINHWAPEFLWILTAVIALYLLELTILMVKYGAMALKWLLVAWR